MQKPTHKDWLFIARQDLEAAKLLAEQLEVFGAAFFLTQQSVEKALRGF